MSHPRGGSQAVRGSGHPTALVICTLRAQKALRLRECRCHVWSKIVPRTDHGGDKGTVKTPALGPG